MTGMVGSVALLKVRPGVPMEIAMCPGMMEHSMLIVQDKFELF